MRGGVSGYVAAQPVGYRTTADQPDFTATENFPYTLDPLQLSRHEMAEYARGAKEAGINYIGSCCGSVAGTRACDGQGPGQAADRGAGWRSTTGKAMSGYEYREHTESEI